MKRTLLVFAAVFVMGIGSASFTLAEAEERGKKDFAAMKEKMYSELGLNEEQKQMMTENYKAQKEEMMNIKSQISAKKEALREAVKAPGVTRMEIQPIADQIKDLHSKMVDRRIDGIFRVKEILTQEQYGKFQEMIAEKKDARKRREWMHGKEGDEEGGKDKPWKKHKKEHWHGM